LGLSEKKNVRKVEGKKVGYTRRYKASREGKKSGIPGAAAKEKDYT